MEEIEKIADECSPALNQIQEQENFLRDKAQQICNIMESKQMTWSDIRTSNPELYLKLSKLIDSIKLAD